MPILYDFSFQDQYNTIIILDLNRFSTLHINAVKLSSLKGHRNVALYPKKSFQNRQ